MNEHRPGIEEYRATCMNLLRDPRFTHPALLAYALCYYSYLVFVDDLRYRVRPRAFGIVDGKIAGWAQRAVEDAMAQFVSDQRAAADAMGEVR